MGILSQSREFGEGWQSATLTLNGLGPERTLAYFQSKLDWATHHGGWSSTATLAYWLGYRQFLASQIPETPPFPI
jgi:hypothetical protein